MTEIEQVEAGLRERLPQATFHKDPAKNPKGSSFLDVFNGEKSVVIEWRPSLGFGISDSTKEHTYGEGPEMTATTVEDALRKSLPLLQ